MIALRNKALIAAAVLIACLSGCANVPTMDQTATLEAINGNPPEGQAGPVQAACNIRKRT